MSRVLKALELSEQNHQQLQHPRYGLDQYTSSHRAVTNKLVLASLIVLPAVFAAIYSADRYYKSSLESWMNSNQPRVIEVDSPFPYTELIYPKFQDLTPTYDVSMVASVKDREALAQEQGIKPIEPKPQSTPVQQEPILDDLDLSGLPPELALRIETALEKSPSILSNESKSSISNLAKESDKWHDKLPALNFQTHVYSSNKAKRWIKVNGVEYNEGDWITERIKLEQIKQHSSEIRFDGELIEIPALYDWLG